MKLINNDRGFTLIEILAVLIILGILVGIAVPKFISIDKTAEQTIVLYDDNHFKRTIVAEYYLLENKTETIEEYTQRRFEERDEE